MSSITSRAPVSTAGPTSDHSPASGPASASGPGPGPGPAPGQGKSKPPRPRGPRLDSARRRRPSNTPGPSTSSRLTPGPSSRLTPGPSSRLTPGPSSRLTPGPSSRLTPGPSSRLTPVPQSSRQTPVPSPASRSALPPSAAKSTPAPTSSSRPTPAPNPPSRLTPAPTSTTRLTPAPASTARITPAPRSTPAPTAALVSGLPRCTNPECSAGDVAEDNGCLICRSCGFVVQEVNITQEVTFGEGANGAAVVQGVFVGADEEGSRSNVLAGSKLGGGLSSRQVTERNGQQQVNNLVAALRLNVTHRDRAMQIYKLAMNMNFVQGRSTREVAAVCLYIACRRDNESKVMLIDFSDLLEINVFKLGAIYNTLVQELGLRIDGVGLYDMNPENLIQRFAQDLEFGADEHRIAHEAVQILKRMRRDWIVTGRRPAGVCGAALILAARMNNYRRTVREVVYTAKVADITIHKRLEEFKFTDSSRLTVAEFRHHGLSLEKEHDPPAFYEQFRDTKKTPRKRKMADVEQEDADANGNLNNGSQQVPANQAEDQNPALLADEEDMNFISRLARAAANIVDGSSPFDPSVALPDQASNNSIRETQKSEADRRAMPPPPLPIDPELLQDGERDLANAANGHENSGSEYEGTEPTNGEISKRRSGRPRGSKNKPLPKKTAQAAADEVEIEDDIDAIINDPQIIADASDVHEHHPIPPALGTPPPTQSEPATAPSEPDWPFAQQQDAASNDSRATTPPARSWISRIPDDPIIPPEEFASDPEVEGCLLTPVEIAIKERIWVHENADYLLIQQARRIKAEMAAAAAAIAHGPGDPQDIGSGRGRQPKKPRRARMGDLRGFGIGAGGPSSGTAGGAGAGNGDNASDAGSVGSTNSRGFKTVAEATRAMMERRGYSRKINYQRIEHLYAPRGKKRKDQSEGRGTVDDNGGDPPDGDGNASPEASADKGKARANTSYKGKGRASDSLGDLAFADADEPGTPGSTATSSLHPDEMSVAPSIEGDNAAALPTLPTTQPLTMEQENAPSIVGHGRRLRGRLVTSQGPSTGQSSSTAQGLSTAASKSKAKQTGRASKVSEQAESATRGSKRRVDTAEDGSEPGDGLS